MSAARTLPEAAKEVLDQRAVGRAVRDLTVLAINALKTLDPPLSALVDRRIIGVEIDDQDRLVIHLDDLDLTVNLERTGRLAWTDSCAPWTPRDGARPTARLLLDDGSGIDFKEPAKTKRIAFTITRR